jgi:hypothetical protein
LAAIAKSLTRKSAAMPKPVKRQKTKKTCISCPPERAEQSVNNFYMSYSPLHADGRLPMCQTCIKEKCYNEDTDDIDVVKFKDILRQLDKPYIESIWQSSISQYNKTYGGKNVSVGNRMKIIGYYFKNIQTLRQYVTLDWKQGVELNNKAMSIAANGIKTVVENKYEPSTTRSDEEERYYIDGLDSFEVTPEIVNLFGSGYRKNEYKAMWDKYQFLKKSYPDVTNLHTEALVTYVRLKVREEQAVALGNASEAEKWATAARSAADKAKINPSQLSQSDLQGGLNSFSELLMAVEQTVDVIPILPRFKFRPNDAIDFNIWCIINYLRDMEGKPLCSYEDIYKFYDQRKAEYIEQYGDPYGIFSGDPTEANRESVKKFITLPKDYEDGEQ